MLGCSECYNAFRSEIMSAIKKVQGRTFHVGKSPKENKLDRDLLSEYEGTISLFGMVKDEYHKTRAITDGEREISIAQEPGVYAFVYKLQEEAHRFAVKSSTGAKIKTLTHSTLEKIKGIGPKKAKLLLSKMPISKIKKASVEELSEIAGISDTDAKNIYDYYRENR